MGEISIPSERPAAAPRFTAAAADLMVLRSRSVAPSMIAAVVAAVAEACDHAPKDLLSPCRRRELAHPRQVAMVLCMELPGASLPQVARAFHRDHTTVVHARRAVRERMSPDLAQAVQRIRERAGMSGEGERGQG